MVNFSGFASPFGGYLDGGLDALASPVDAVLVEQFERLKRLVETGQNQNALKTQ